MIPTHELHCDLDTSIEVHRLNELTDYDFGIPHRHSYYEFFYFEKGGGSHDIDFVSFPIHDNSVHVVAPGRVHQVKRELNSKGFVFLFDLAQFAKGEEYYNFLFEDGVHDVEEFPVTFQLRGENEFIQKQIEDILSISKTSIAHLTAKNSIQNLIIQCLLTMNSKGFVVENVYSEFRRLILRDVQKRRTVSSFADELGVTIKKLNDLTKKHSGATPSKIIQNQICIEAKRLLLSGMTVKQVAYHLGFNDPAHFSKLFKANSKLSPREFQKHT